MIKSHVNNALTLLNIPIFSRTKKDGLEKVKKYLLEVRSKKLEVRSKERKPFVIFTPNPEIIVYAQDDKKFRQILKQADLALPDGIGVVWASRLLKNKELRIKNKEVKERITGVDFMMDLINLAAKNSLTIGLIGGKKNVALDALECLKRRYLGLSGWAVEGPEMEVRSEKMEVGSRMFEVRDLMPETRYLKCENKTIKSFSSPKSVVNTVEKGKKNKLVRVEASFDGKHDFATVDQFIAVVIRKIQETKTTIVFIGLGHPKQEYFTAVLSQRLVESSYLRPIVLMTVGGAFDTISGRLSRAPQLLRHLGLEWLYRLVRQPWRIRRQLALGKFVCLVAREYLDKFTNTASSHRKT